MRALLKAIEGLRKDIDRILRKMVRIGTVHSVDLTACTVVVTYLGPDADVQSLPMPWLQRSTEHRPPAVGDQALVIDPSLGRGAALAITGWPSTARPAVDGGGAGKHVLYKGGDTAKVDAPLVELGQSPSDFASLAAKTDAEFARVWDLLTSSSIVPAPTSGPDAGETGLTTLKTAAATAKLLVQSVAASQVKIK